MTKRLTFFGRTIQIRADKGTSSGRLIQVSYGKGKWIGAGYTGGFTAFAAFKCVAPSAANGTHTATGKLRSMYVRERFQFGVTQNGNMVPFTSN